MKINKNQQDFFENYFENSIHNIFLPNIIYDSYVNGAQYRALSIYKYGNVLDYGCGNGELIERFKHVNPSFNKKFIGVDISDSIINIAKKKYNEHYFFNIKNTNTDKIIKSNFGFMMHVLHHTDKHDVIFNNIYNLLEKDSYFIIEDLFSANPFIKYGRLFFKFMPVFIKKRFKGDLIVNNQIPEKLSVNFNKTLELLSDKFTIVNVEYSQLFCFIFIWLINLTNQYNNKFLISIFKFIYKIEKYLINNTFLYKFCEVRTIYVYKK